MRELHTSANSFTAFLTGHTQLQWYSLVNLTAFRAVALILLVCGDSTLLWLIIEERNLPLKSQWKKILFVLKKEKQTNVLSFIPILLL